MGRSTNLLLLAIVVLLMAAAVGKLRDMEWKLPALTASLSGESADGQHPRQSLLHPLQLGKTHRVTPPLPGG